MLSCCGGVSCSVCDPFIQSVMEFLIPIFTDVFTCQCVNKTDTSEVKALNKTQINCGIKPHNRISNVTKLIFT